MIVDWLIYVIYIGTLQKLWDLLLHVYSQFVLKYAHLVKKLNGSRQHKFVHN